ncbi:Pvc16 family protein [Intrasporangium sp.]|uniref:Pvc16 family protein n=1 Tax=Intrasporangium sp. TaxID=1925024 RepID=UPI00322191FF
MSSPLAIATVTAVLKDLLNDGLVNSDLSASVGTVAVSALPPDRISTGTDEPSRLNLFLYQVTANPGWRNEQYPSRDPEGRRVSGPPLPLDLHYLLTAYGAEDLDAEILLGYAMQLLHEMPVLTPDLIRRTFSVTSPVTDKLMPPSVPDRNAADLADQVETCRIAPRYLTTEELSRLWSAMQARYRPSMAYDVSVVLIEATTPTRAALPVRVPALTLATLGHPMIDDVTPAVALPGDTVTLTGSGLKGAVTTVRVGGIETLPGPDDVTDAAISLTLPGGLRAGVNPVQVVHQVPVGTPPVPHAGVGFESNVAALVLAPAVTTPQPITVARDTDLNLTVTPPVGREQRAAILVGETVLAVPPRAPAAPETSTTITAHIPSGATPGTYLLRVQVDGALSALEVDDNDASPTFEQYVGPLIEVT